MTGKDSPMGNRGVGAETCLLLLSFALLAVSCAVVQPPSGGPEDKTPPHVVSVLPVPDSAGVDRETELRITFSEKVDGDTFKERIHTYPAVPFDDIGVKGDILTVRFAETLPETSLAVVLSSGYSDMHGVRSDRSFIFHFATAPELQEGVITGRVLFKDELDPDGVVKLHAVTADSVLQYKREKESRIAFTGDDGGFRFEALPTDSARFILWAFSDKNGDGRFGEEKEFHLLHPDTIVLMPSRRTATDIFLNIIDPNEPGMIDGSIVDETGLGTAPTVRLEPLLPGEQALVARSDTTGYYSLRKVPPGRYLLLAFIDISPDSLCGDYTSPEDSTITLKEPCLTLPDTIMVEPGREKTLEPIRLTGGTE